MPPSWVNTEGSQFLKWGPSAAVSSQAPPEDKNNPMGAHYVSDTLLPLFLGIHIEALWAVCYHHANFTPKETEAESSN